LDHNIILLGAGTRGVIAIQIDKIKKNKPKDVVSVQIGSSVIDSVATKDKKTAFVLADGSYGNILEEIKWNYEKSMIEVVRSNQLAGMHFDKIIMET
jgi:hypothetical protein